jgi:hypothetical protein
MRSNLGNRQGWEEAAVRVFAPVGIDACGAEQILSTKRHPLNSHALLAMPHRLGGQPRRPWYRDPKHCGWEPRKGSRWA